jgi:hypothetical protein
MAVARTMNFKLKTLSKEGVEAAFEKLEQYRLLNEPREAESICRDILEVEPENQRALASLLLSLTDQFPRARPGILEAARALIPHLDNEYEKAYYGGIICERQGKAIFHRQQPGGGKVTYVWLKDAMDSYEQAEELRPPGNDNARLRWNRGIRGHWYNKGVFGRYRCS